MSGGGGGPTSSTVTQSTIPEQFYPQVTGLLGAAGQQLFSGYETPTVDGKPGPFTITGPKPFEAYSTAGYRGPSGRDVVAQLQPGQQQALGIANWLGADYVRDASGNIVTDPQTGNPVLGGQGFINEQYGRAGDFASRMGWGGQQVAGYFTKDAQGNDVFVPGAAQQIGQAGQQAGATGQQLGVQGGAYYGGLGAGYGGAAAELSPFSEQYAGRAAGLGGMYEQMATSDPNDPLGRTAMSRYMSPYMKDVVAQQQEGAIRQKRIADQQREAAAARAGAFGGARQAIERTEADRALQSQLQGIEAKGLQDAFTQAQGNILQRAQLEAQGLAGAQQGLGQAGQLYGMGMQGAGMGLQGLQSQLAGTAQGMQGAGMGLQGIQSALGGYGLMGQAGTSLADITAGRLRDVMGVGQFQFGMGEQQRQLEQQAINQQILNYQMAQERPFEALSRYNALLRGYIMPGQTTTQYQANAPIGSQLAGLGTAGFGLGQLANVGKKAGGTVRGGDGIVDLALNRAKRGEFV